MLLPATGRQGVKRGRLAWEETRECGAEACAPAGCRPNFARKSEESRVLAGVSLDEVGAWVRVWDDGFAVWRWCLLFSVQVLASNV